MADLVFGQIPGIYPGRTFSARADLRAAGVHMPPMHGIQGNPEDGADSIVLSGGYPDDEDVGDVIIFTGAGGQHRLKRIQLENQSFSDRWNAALVRSHLDARPVRVTSGNGKTKKSPDKYIYRGLYLVDDYWYKIGAEGFRMCRFKMVKTDDASPIDIISDDRSTPPPQRIKPYSFGDIWQQHRTFHSSSRLGEKNLWWNMSILPHQGYAVRRPQLLRRRPYSPTGLSAQWNRHCRQYALSVPDLPCAVQPPDPLPR